MFSPRPWLKKVERKQVRGRERRWNPLRLEPLEDRTLLSSDIVVGRTLSAYTLADVQNNEVTITYTVYNQQAESVSGILLTDTLQPGVTFESASVLPDRNGQELAWSLGTLEAFGRASVQLTVSLTDPTPLQLDSGARAFGTLNAGVVTDAAPAATLRTDVIAAELLASTPDANTTDPFIQQKAAELDYDPQRIFDFLRLEIGYESYVGSLRGARGTLWSGAGNALDEASLGVALMRVSGIPSRYAQGTLSDALAKDLILSMFQDPLRVVGFIDPGIAKADPASDPAILAETREHYWFQFDTGTGMTDADPLMAGAVVGQTFTASLGTFGEVPESLRAKTRVQLVVETINAADGLFGASSGQLQTVLDQTFNDVDLVGRPISIGHFVNSSTFGLPIFGTIIHSYSPYISQGDAAQQDPLQAHLIRGQDYQEVLTNFPISSNVVTGLFLDVTTVNPGPGRQTHSSTVEKTLFDRIGFAARRGGGTRINLGDLRKPVLNNQDITAISVSVSRQDDAAVLAGKARLEALSASLGAAFPGDGVVAAGNVGALARATAVEITSLLAQAFLFLSDESNAGIDAGFLAKSYFVTPRVFTVTSRVTRDAVDNTARLGIEIDLLQNVGRVLLSPLQAPVAERNVRVARGSADSLLEGSVLGSYDPAGTALSSAQVFGRAVIDEHRPVSYVDATQLNVLDALPISSEAKARITHVVLQGKAVFVPDGMIEVDGRSTVAWIQYDPQTGDTIFVSEDGGHQATVEYEGVEITVDAEILSGEATAAEAEEAALAQLKELLDALKMLPRNQGTKNTVRAYRHGFLRGLQSLNVEGNPAFITFKATISLELFLLEADPPLPDFLVQPAALLGFGTLGSNGEVGVATGVLPDPVFTVPFVGAELPTAFRIGIKNLGPAADTFTVALASAPTGFLAKTSVSTLALGTGQSGEVGLALTPTAGLPAPGTQLAFDVIVTSTFDPTITQTLTYEFTVPAVHALALTANPAAVATLPGVGVPVEITITNVGNLAEDNTALDVVLSSGLMLTGLGPVSLLPGQSTTRTITLTPDAATPLGSSLAVAISGPFRSPDGPIPQQLNIPVAVRVPGATAILDAAIAAQQVGNTALAGLLNDLSIALTNLTQQPGSAVFRSQSLASLESILTLLAVDPILLRFVTPLSAARDVLADAQDAPQIQAAIVALGAVLDDFGPTVSALRHHNVTVVLSPSSQPAQPGAPQNFGLLLRNVGDQTTTYDLSLLGLPAGVTGSFNQPAVTLAPGEFSSGVFARLTQTSTEELAAFTFFVQATAAGFPEVVATATGSLSTRREFVSVAVVTLDQPFVDPGTQVNVSARLLNAVNRQQQGRASFVVTNAGGQAVFTSPPVPVQLGVQTSLLDVNLGTINTTALAPGQYDVEVTVTDSANNPIPGATRRTTLLVGSPLTASQIVGPQNLPPGTATVLNTLQINSTVPLGDPLSLVGFLPVHDPIDDNDFNNDFLHSLALNGNVVYVFGEGGIHVVDVTDLAHPRRLTTVRDGGLFFGGRRTGGLVVGDRLFTVDNGTYTNIPILNNSTLSNSGLGGAFAGSPQRPVQIDLVELNYQFLGDFVVSPDGTHLFATLISVNFTEPAHEIFSQSGTLISFDVSNPANLTFTPNSILLNGNGTQSEPPLFISGGNFNMSDVEQPNATTLLVASTTSTGADTQVGVGRLLVIDVSDPDNINSDAPNPSKIVNYLDIPGTVLTQGLALDGNLALVVASEGGFLNPFPGSIDPDPTGNQVLATVDISDPRNPTLIHVRTLNRAAEDDPLANVIPLGNRRFAFASRGEATDTPQLFIVDASDPTNVQIVLQLDVPSPITGLRTDGNFLYTTAADGLTIYRLNVSEIAGTAEVQIPNGTGVEVVPGSFEVAPTQIIPGTDFDTLVWDFTFDQTSAAQTLTWQSTVSNLQPGESRPVTLGSTIDFAVQGAPGQITLPEQNVFAEQILALAPATQIARPGQSAAYTLTITNPTQVGVTYDLSVQGIPPEWVAITSQITVSANSSIQVPLTLTSDPFAPLAEFGFVVTASVSGTTGSVTGNLTLQGDPVLPTPNPDARGVVASVTPTQATAGQGTSAVYVVRVTNTGSVTDTFTLSVPAIDGLTTAFSQTSVVVPPGASNFREVTLVVTPAAGTTPDDYPFTVTATSATQAGVGATVGSTVAVVASGVTVAFDPMTGRPGDVLELTVTNTGQVQDVFDLALAAPVALVSTLEVASVTLAPGERRTVLVNVGEIDFAFPGEIQLVGIATSRTDPAVRNFAVAPIAIAPRTGLEVTFESGAATLTQPGETSFLLLVKNLGNVEGEFQATIAGTQGPVSAQLLGLDGQPTNTIPLFRLPGLSSGAILVRANLADVGQGGVSVQVRSLDGTTSSTAMALARTASVVSPPTPTDFPPPVVPSVFEVAFSAGARGGLLTLPAGPGALNSVPFPGFAGEVRVARGDVNGDGVPDPIYAAGAGAPGGHVKVFDGRSGAELFSFFAFAQGFVGGAMIGAGDVNGDGFTDVLVGAGAGSPGGHVKAYDGRTGAELRSFLAFAGFSGEVRVGCGDVDGDGRGDVIVGAGPGHPGAHVKAFSGVTGLEVRSFFAFAGFVGGVFVGSADVDGDGTDEVVVGADAGAGPHVKAFGINDVALMSFLAYRPDFLGGVRVGGTDVEGDGEEEIVTGNGPGARGHVTAVGLDGLLASLFATGEDATGGIFVG